MEREAKIGSGQLFALLFLCRLLTTVTFSPLLSDGLLNGDSFINIVFAAIFILLLCIPAALFYKKFPLDTPVSVTEKKVSVILAVFYAVLFIYSASISISRFYIFLTSVIYSEKKMGLLLVIGILVGIYCAYLGIEALARGNVILLFITALATGIVLLSVSGKIDIYNFEPLFFHPVTESVKSGLFAATRTVEISAFLFLASKTKGRIKKSFIMFFIVFVLSLLVLFFFLNGVSGEFAKTQLLPFFSLAIIGGFPFFERPDAVITAIWIFSSLIKSSLFIFIAKEQLSRFPKINNNISLAICFAAVSVMSLVFSINLNVHRTVGSPYVFIVLTALGTVVIPLILLIKGKRRDSA